MGALYVKRFKRDRALDGSIRPELKGTMNLLSSIIPASATEPTSRSVILSDAERLAAVLATQNAIAISRLDIPSLMQLIVERSQELTCAEGAVFELRDEEEMVYRAVCGTTASFLGLRLSIHASLSGRSVLTGEILKCDDTETDAGVDREACRKVGARSLIVVPLRYQEKIQGVLKVLASAPFHFSKADVQSLELMAGLFGAVMGHASTFHSQQEEAERQARALAVLREEREQQRRLFDAALSWIADYVFICNLEGRLTYANRARLALWHRELDDVLGKNFFELGYPEELAARIHSQIETVISTREPLRAQADYTDASGMAGYYDYILVPVLNAVGEVEAVAGSTRDISQIRHTEKENERLLKTLQVERERLSELFLRAPAFIAVLRGPTHIFERVNPPYLQLTEHRDLLGKPVRDVFPDLAGQGFFEILDEVYQTGKPFVGKEICILSQEVPGAPLLERHIEFVYQPLVEADGSISGIFMHGIDLTERKRSEQILEERAKEIQSLNHRLTRSMKETHHRVKNNLQVISAMIEMQVVEHHGEGSVPLEEFIRLKAHVHTLSIVHDLLTVNIKENEDAQRVSTKAVLEKLLPMLQQTAWKKRVRYTVAEAELTSKQCIALSLVLNELVSNALKHGKNEAEVVFSVNGEHAVLVVYDDGEGFPEGFDPLKAANTGLELVDSLVRTDLMGTISFGNQSHGGGQVSVTFSLPADEE